MHYLLLIYSDETAYPDMSEEEIGKIMMAYGQYTEELQASGALVTSDRLKGTDSATTVRVRDGKQLTTDGPFAETKEQLGGYYEINVDNLDEAIGWAAKIPSASYGCVEVRPVWPAEEYMNE